MTIAPPSFAGYPFAALEDAASVPTRASLALWLDATAGVVTDGATSRVTAWNSRSGSVAVSQATTAKMPLLVAEAQNGLPVIRGDGVDDLLATTAAFPWAMGMTLFAVARSAGALASSRYVCGYQISGDAGESIKLGSSSASVEFATGSTTVASDPSGTLDPTIMHVYAGVVGTASAEIWVDGASNGATANGIGYASTTAPFLVFNRNASTTGNILGGDIGEVLVYSRALSSVERQSVQAYLRTKWGTA